MQKPAHLSVGDTVGILSPAGPVDKEKLDKAIPFLERLGLRVLLGDYVYAKNGFLAGTDAERIEDLHKMIGNPTVKAIFCARGGYGTGRIAHKLNMDLLQSNPKIIWGYSDITYLHTVIRQQTDLITFHGPMIASDISSEAFDKQSENSFEQLFIPQSITYDETISQLHVISAGEAKGTLVGGNLSVLMSTMGTPHEIDVKDCILLIEDIGEAPYQIDSLCNQLKQSGKLDEVAGIVIGDFRSRTLDQTVRSEEFEPIFEHYFSHVNKPVIAGFQFGHCFPNIGIPLGAEATLSSEPKRLHIEPGVK